MIHYPHFIIQTCRAFFITLFLLSVTGCSSLSYIHDFHIEDDNNQWVKMTDATASKYPQEIAQYKNNLMTATIKNINTVSGCFFVGPPLLPILPIYPACLDKSLNLDMKLTIDNLSNNLIIDFREVKLLKSPNQTIHVCTAPYCPVGDGHDLQACPNGNFGYAMSDLISTWQYMMNKDTYTFELTFCKIGHPEELTLEFGKMTSEGKEINIPPLKLKRRNRVGYIPLTISDDAKVFWIR